MAKAAVPPDSSKAPVQTDKRTIEACDGYPLATTLFTPKDRKPEFVVIVGPAVGVAQGFYEPYARFLASRGCAALTFDFRGIGRSLDGSVKNSAATLHDWGEKDFDAIINAMCKAFPELDIMLVGHSISGQLFGTLDASNRVTAVCTVAAQHAYWWSYPFKQRLGYGVLWHMVVPLVVSIVRYFPGRRFGMQDLPKGVALGWGQWCRSPHYMVDRQGEPARKGCDSYSGPILAYSFSDDDRATAILVAKLHREYKVADVEYRHVVPDSIGERKVGHVGFFRSRCKGTLWTESLDWLRSKAGSTAGKVTRTEQRNKSVQAADTPVHID